MDILSAMNDIMHGLPIYFIYQFGYSDYRRFVVLVMSNCIHFANKGIVIHKDLIQGRKVIIAVAGINEKW